jgi:hypothetical protein
VDKYYNYIVDKLAFERQTCAAHSHAGDPRIATWRLRSPHCWHARTLVWYNVVDSPVGVVPITRVDPVRDEPSDEWRGAPGSGSKILESDIALDD